MRTAQQVVLALAMVSANPLFGETKEGQAGIAVQSQGVSMLDLPGAYYAAVELRHHLNTYYRTDGDRGRQTPTFHARAKVGAIFRDNFIDAFMTFGVLKGASTQQIQQRRPEFEVDLYPLLGTYGQLVQYHVIQMPFEESELERQESEPGAPHTDGTIYTVGIAPTGIYPLMLGASSIELKVGADGWTQFFSRRQYRNDETTPDERDHFGLGEEDSSNASTEEDVAQRYYTQYMVGTSLTPAFAPQVELEVGVYYDVRYLPDYEQTEERTSYTYDRLETSHYRARFQIALSERASFINDFYHFHEGFFASQRIEDDRRFRNIARLTYKL